MTMPYPWPSCGGLAAGPFVPTELTSGHRSITGPRSTRGFDVEKEEMWKRRAHCVRRLVIGRTNERTDEALLIDGHAGYKLYSLVVVYFATLTY